MVDEENYGRETHASNLFWNNIGKGKKKGPTGYNEIHFQGGQ